MPEPEPQLQSEAAASLTKERKAILVLVLCVGLFMALAHFTPLRAWLENAQAWKQTIREWGWMAHMAFMGLTSLAVMIGVPRIALCAAAGLLFGFAEGAALSLIGTTMGSYGAFLAVRKGFRANIANAVRSRPWIETMLREPSVMKVFWIRQLALPGLVLNVMLGLAEIRHRVFLTGTILGYLPLNVAASLVGSGLGKADLQHTLMQLLAALAVINLVAWWLWKKVRSEG